MQLFGETWKVVPKVFVFDVDNTLWPYWCDTDLRPPFAPGPDGKLHDGGGKAIEMFGDVRSVMLELHRAGARVAFASRTDQPSWLENIARQMKLTEDTSLWDVAEFHEIYSTSKHEHFHAIKRQSGCPHDAMLFFDDEARNRNVEELGVTFVDAEGGLTQEMVKAGLREYERRHID